MATPHNRTGGVCDVHEQAGTERDEGEGGARSVEAMKSLSPKVFLG